MDISRRASFALMIMIYLVESTNGEHGRVSADHQTYQECCTLIHQPVRAQWLQR